MARDKFHRSYRSCCAVSNSLVTLEVQAGVQYSIPTVHQIKESRECPTARSGFSGGSGGRAIEPKIFAIPISSKLVSFYVEINPVTSDFFPSPRAAAPNPSLSPSPPLFERDLVAAGPGLTLPTFTEAPQLPESVIAMTF